MSQLKIVTVIQARTGSTRLPHKVLMSLCGKPLLVRMVERVMSAQLAGTVVVATSTDKSDNTIEEICKAEGIECFRGELNDLLDRHYQTAKKYNADAVAKIPSDCPLIDPEIIDKVFKFYIDNIDKYDFVSNLHPATYPDGNDVEIMSFKTIETAWKEAERKLEREHTTPFIWENPEKFRIGNVLWETGFNYSAKHRWTIDYEEDYIFIRTVYEELYKKNPKFSINNILNLLKDKPFIYDINSRYIGKYWYENHLEELNQIDDYKKELKKS